MRAEDALRLFVGAAGEPGPAPFVLAPGVEFDLPDAAAAHVKVRRLQPGAALRLFDGASGFEWPAEVRAITRGAVQVRLAGAPVAATAAELPVAVALAFGMPANERVDALVEKATELGVAALWPLMSERSVLRLEGERAERRRAHWQAVAAAACEQCGRARVPQVHAVQPLRAWLRSGAPPGLQAGSGAVATAADGAAGAASAAVAAGATAEARAAGSDREAGVPTRWLLSTQADAPPLAEAGPWRGAAQGARPTAPGPLPVLVLSGPEGGFTPAETEAAQAAGFAAVSLGPRTLRADTAPLAVLAWLAIALAQRPEPKAGA